MNTVKSRLPALRNEIGTADIGCQHGLFNQLVGIIAGPWHNFFYSPALIANDLSLHGFKVNSTTLDTGFRQSPIHVVQVQ